MKSLKCFLAAGAVTLLMGAANAQTPGAPLIKNMFEDGVDSWQGFGQTANVTVTHDEHNIKEGKSALQLDYGVNKGEINLAMLPTPDAVLAKAKTFRFWIKTDQATSCALVLQEKDGGRYASVFATPNAGWQKVEIAVSDLMLSESETDPKDPDGKLDLDQVEGLGIIDLAQIAAGAPESPLTKGLNVKLGAHSLFLSSFMVDDAPLPAAPKPAAGEVMLDGFNRPQLSWLNLGGADLSHVSAKPLEGPGMQAKYRSAADRVSFLLRPISRGLLSNADRILFSIASAKPTKFLVQLEQIDGNKFNSVISTDGNSALQQMRIAFTDFTVADDSKDTHATLDLKKVKSFMLADVSGMIDKVDRDNTLWLGNLRVGLAK